MKTCCFAGHSEINNKDEVYENLLSAIEELIIKEQVTRFMAGNYGQFDGVSARTVRKLKEKYPHVTLELVIPYLTESITQYKEMYYKDYDSILMADIPPKTPKRLQIIKCNEYMVSSSDFVVCYINHSWGGAAKTMDYARRKNKSIINLGEL